MAVAVALSWSVACSSSPPGSATGTGASGGADGTGVGGAGGSPGTGGLADGSGGTIPAGIFVSPSGSDTAAGTFDAPFATVARARDEVRTMNADMSEDIHVFVRGGRYEINETIEFGPEDSGANGHRVVYSAYEGERPILTGATQVTGWTPHEGEIFKAPLERTTKLRNLYVGGQRARLASKNVQGQGGEGTYSVTAGQADWAWASGSKSDGVRYALGDVPATIGNPEDLEIVNGTTWNENIACVRGVTTAGSNRVLLLQQPYGAIAQLPGWNAGFSTTGAHTIQNALEFLDEPGEFYFDKTAQTLYYFPRDGEDMSSVEVEAPHTEVLVSVAGLSNTERVTDITFQGLTFTSTDYGLVHVGDSCGKATVQGATTYIAFGSDNWHLSKYEIVDTLPAMIDVRNAERIALVRNVIEHSGSEGVAMTNDVIGSSIVGNYIHDVAGSGITVGHPQHVYLDDGGEHARFSAEVEGLAVDNRIENNVLHDVSSVRGFGGHAGVTAFFVEGLVIEHNHVETTAYNGINLGWGWRNFQDSTTAKDNSVGANRLLDTLHRLHDSGAIYTLGQMPGTTINENYVRGIPAATSGPTYGLHNDEGSAYITENDNVLDIAPGVTYTINSEDFGEKHDLTILRTYATVSKMGVDPPNSTIDPPIAVPDNIWPLAQYETCAASGVEDEFKDIFPEDLVPVADWVLPASVEVEAGVTLTVRSSGQSLNALWLAPAGTVDFTEGPTMTTAPGDASSIAVPEATGAYRLHVLDSTGTKLGESTFQVRAE